MRITTPKTAAEWLEMRHDLRLFSDGTKERLASLKIARSVARPDQTAEIDERIQKVHEELAWICSQQKTLEDSPPIAEERIEVWRDLQLFSAGAEERLAALRVARSVARPNQKADIDQQIKKVYEELISIRSQQESLRKQGVS